MHAGFTLALNRMPKSFPHPTEESAAGGGVLVVEDRADVRDALAMLLSIRGFVVRTAAHGLEALRVIRETGAPAVIVLDLLMPVMDGWQLSAALSEDRDLASVPIIVLSTEHDDGRPIPQAIAKLRKPAEADEICDLVARCCRDRSADRAGVG